MTGSARGSKRAAFSKVRSGSRTRDSVGVVRDDRSSNGRWDRTRSFRAGRVPLVTETADGWLNDINGFFVKPEHVKKLWRTLKQVRSRKRRRRDRNAVLRIQGRGRDVLQKTTRKTRRLDGRRVRTDELRQALSAHDCGVPVGQHEGQCDLDERREILSSRMTVRSSSSIATDAPLLPHQLKRLAKRASLGMARTGSLGGNGSGDIFLAVLYRQPQRRTGRRERSGAHPIAEQQLLTRCLPLPPTPPGKPSSTPMIAAEDMTGRNGLTVRALPHAVS
ncbi:MAG: P1 family peptidase [Ignavibacteriales bacterium]|nr:P1 family peptidase [Ignavibacteriales bacterium]